MNRWVNDTKIKLIAKSSKILTHSHTHKDRKTFSELVKSCSSHHKRYKKGIKKPDIEIFCDSNYTYIYALIQVLF